MTNEELDAIRHHADELRKRAAIFRADPWVTQADPTATCTERSLLAIDALLAEVERLQERDAERTGHPTLWRVQIFNLRGSLVKDYHLGFLPSLLNMIHGGSAIYTRVR